MSAIPNVSVYSPGADITAAATAPITSRTFVAISGSRASGGTGNISVATAAPGVRAAGVAKTDAASGQLVALARGNSRVVKVTADGAIAAGVDVEVGANGRAKSKTTGVAVGYAVTAAAAGADAQISLL